MTVFIAWLVEFFYILALKISELLPPYGTVDCISTLMEGFIWWDIMAPLRCEATPFITLVHSTISIRKSPAPAGLFRQTEAEVSISDLCRFLFWGKQAGLYFSVTGSVTDI